jgi:hypothetical protein
MYEILDHICSYVKLFIVWLLIALNRIYSYDVLYILCNCTVRNDEREMYVCMYVYVCTYVCMCLHAWKLSIQLRRGPARILPVWYIIVC